MAVNKSTNTNSPCATNLSQRKFYPLFGDVKDFEEYVAVMASQLLNLPTLLPGKKRSKRRGGRVRINTDGLGNLVHRRNILPEAPTALIAYRFPNADNEAA